MNQQPGAGETGSDLLTRILHQLVARPSVYDQVQTLVGARHVRTRLAAQLSPLRESSVVADIGGGTGLLQQSLPKPSTHICIDLDPVKLAGFRRKYPTGIALQADAVQLPIEDKSVDVVVCSAVTHHLPDQPLKQLVSESARVLREQGSFILVDAVWVPGNWPGRLLWRFDRGSHPRTAEHLLSIFSPYYDTTFCETFRIWHEYILYVGARRRRSDSVGAEYFGASEMTYEWKDQ